MHRLAAAVLSLTVCSAFPRRPLPLPAGFVASARRVRAPPRALRRAFPEPADAGPAIVAATPPAGASWASTGLPAALARDCESLGWPAPTAVQRLALPTLLGGADAVLTAPTGTGKTLAFLLPLLAGTDPSRSATQAVVVAPTRELALQTARAARRLCAAARRDGRAAPTVLTALDGGGGRRAALWARAAPPQVAVGNALALARLFKTGALAAGAVRYVVVDEVDACLGDDSAREALHELLARRLSPSFGAACDARGGGAPHLLRKGQDVGDSTADGAGDGAGDDGLAGGGAGAAGAARQTVFASATLPQRRHFSQQAVQQQWSATTPVALRLRADDDDGAGSGSGSAAVSAHLPVSLTHSLAIIAEPAKKLAALRAIVRSVVRDPGFCAVVFVAAGRPIDAIAAALDGDIAAALGGAGGGGGESGGAGGGAGSAAEPAARWRGAGGTGGTSAAAGNKGRRAHVAGLAEASGLESRDDALARFRRGDVRVLVSSDLAARGIDVPAVSHVLQLDMPLSADEYLHRAGRAGRQGRPGTVVTVCTKKERFVATRFANKLGMEFSVFGRKRKTAAGRSEAAVVETAVPRLEPAAAAGPEAVLTVGGPALSLDALGPVVVGKNGGLSYIANWQEMTAAEQEATRGSIGKRNEKRRAALLLLDVDVGVGVGVDDNEAGEAPG